MKTFIELVSIKAEIWQYLGYHEDAYNLQEKIKTIIETKLSKMVNNAKFDDESSHLSQVDFEGETELSEQNYELLLCNCRLSMAEIQSHKSNFQDSIFLLTQAQKKISETVFCNRRFGYRVQLVSRE